MVGGFGFIIRVFIRSSRFLDGLLLVEGKGVSWVVIKLLSDNHTEIVNPATARANTDSITVAKASRVPAPDDRLLLRGFRPVRGAKIQV